MKKVTVYSGRSIVSKCTSKLHPVDEVRLAEAIVHKAKSENRNEITFSNSHDFVMAVKYIALKQGVETEFLLDGVSHGNSIEPTFASFNESLDLINELGATED